MRLAGVEEVQPSSRGAPWVAMQKGGDDGFLVGGDWICLSVGSLAGHKVTLVGSALLWPNHGPSPAAGARVLTQSHPPWPPVIVTMHDRRRQCAQ